MGDCHSTLQRTQHSQNSQTDSSPIRPDSSSWVLPPIPSFEELGLRFDRSRTSSANAIVEGGSLRNGPQEQTQDQQGIQLGATESLIQGEGNDNGAFAMGESESRWSGENIRNDNAVVVPEMIHDNHPSIFDDILSDNNESYIIWSTPSAGAKLSLFSTMAGPSSSGVAALVTTVPESSKHPAGSDVPSSATQHKQQQHHSSSSLDKEATSAGQDRSMTKQWSTIEPLSVRIAEFNRSTDNLCSPVQPKPSKQGSNSPAGSSPRLPKTPPASTATELQQSNRVIMAATVEKLVEKLTSEIDYTFLTDFFLIYRLFITPMALLKLIIVRFHWALVDDSPQRQIVRIRTFVTLRHWLLNYFEFDFMRSKDLRHILGLYLRSLTTHPRVTSSTREQRIVKELRRYAQSLKTIHYRKQAQQKLERQSRKQVERRRRHQAIRPSTAYQGSHTERPLSSIAQSVFQGQSSSNRSSFILGAVNRQTTGSEALMEILAVELRSSDQSDDYDDLDDEDEDEDEDFYDDDGDNLFDEQDDYNDMYSESGDSTGDNGFEPSSDNSFYDTEYDSEYSVSVDDGEDNIADNGDPDQHQQPAMESVGKRDVEVKGLSVQEGDLQSECHLPSPAFSPRSGKAHQEASGSLRSRPAVSAESSTTSRARARGARPGLPDFQAGYNGHTMTNPSPLHQTSAPGSRGGSRAKTHSRPLSTFQPLLSPPLCAPPLSPHGSLRSVEPYMNPPPRSVASIEKKKPWSRYMNATVGRLSKMKRVFTSNASKNEGRDEEGGATGSNTSELNQSRSERYWQGNLSDPESEKVSYLLACPGMNIFLSSSEDRHHIFGRGGSGSKGGAAKEDGRSGWSSEGDYSQHDLTCQRNRGMMLPNEEQEPEPESSIGGITQVHDRHPELLHQQQQYEAANENFMTPALDGTYVDAGTAQETGSLDQDSEAGRSVCSECGREQYLSSPMALQVPILPISMSADTTDEDKTGANTDAELTAMCHWQGECECDAHSTKDLDIADFSMTSTSRVPNLRRTNQRRARGQRASWMTLSSTTSSIFGPLLNGNHLPPRQAIRQRSALGNVDRFVERFYGSQSMPVTEDVDPTQGPSVVPIMAETSQHVARELSVQDVAPGEQEQIDAVVEDVAVVSVQDDAHLHHGDEPLSVHPLDQAYPADPLTRIVATSHSGSIAPAHGQAGSSRTLIQSQPPTARPVRPTLGPGRSNSQPNLLTSFSDADVGSVHDGVVPWHHQEPSSHILDHCRHRPPQSPSQSSRGADHHHHSHDHARRRSVEPSMISQPSSSRQERNHRQRSQPRLRIQVGPRLTSAPEPVSIVLRYSSELIAQQLCLIEREMLSQVQWYELVDAGWTKKTPAETAIAGSSSSSASVAASYRETSRESRTSAASSIHIDEASLAADGVGSTIQETGVADGSKGGDSVKDVNRSKGTVAPTPKMSGDVGGHPKDSRISQQRPKTEDSRGIKRLVDRFNLTCQWVTSEIVRTRDLHQRVKVVEKFIRIAQTCYNHSNFSSLIQLMLGLQSHSVSRLNQTWARVRAQEMRIMEDLVEYTSPFHNWKHLRDDMKSIADEWGGSGGGVSASGTEATTAAISTSEKVPPSSGGTTSSFFGKRPVNSSTSAKAIRDSSTMTTAGGMEELTPNSKKSGRSVLSSSYLSASPFQHKGVASSGVASKVSSIAQVKEKEVQKEKQEKEATVATPKGCIPFLGLYLSDLVFNAELPSFVEGPKNNNLQSQRRQQQRQQQSQSSGQTSNPKTIETRLLVNIHKHRTTATIIKRILTFKTLAVRYPFEQDPDVRKLLMSIQGLDPTEISRLSSAYEDKAPDHGQ
ncbi:hypothetical protein BGX23_010755 [Mortierella sp. AD031]|nr:hypothetical protein BGX23_010755 [Mortierella sp. AD031]